EGRGTALGFVEDQETAPSLDGFVLEDRAEHQARGAQAVDHGQSQGMSYQTEELDGVEDRGDFETDDPPADGQALNQLTSQPGLARARLAREQQRTRPPGVEDGLQALQHPSTTGDDRLGRTDWSLLSGPEPEVWIGLHR